MAARSCPAVERGRVALRGRTPVGYYKDPEKSASTFVTFDGDVWLAKGLAGAGDEVEWKRFASGFHEPLGLCIRDREVFVFDRNGIWRVVFPVRKFWQVPSQTVPIGQRIWYL